MAAVHLRRDGRHILHGRHRRVRNQAVAGYRRRREVLSVAIGRRTSAGSLQADVPQRLGCRLLRSLRLLSERVAADRVRGWSDDAILTAAAVVLGPWFLVLGPWNARIQSARVCAR